MAWEFPMVRGWYHVMMTGLESHGTLDIRLLLLDLTLVHCSFLLILVVVFVSVIPLEYYTCKAYGSVGLVWPTGPLAARRPVLYPV